MTAADGYIPTCVWYIPAAIQGSVERCCRRPVSLSVRPGRPTQSHVKGCRCSGLLGSWGEAGGHQAGGRAFRRHVQCITVCRSCVTGQVCWDDARRAGPDLRSCLGRTHGRTGVSTRGVGFGAARPPHAQLPAQASAVSERGTVQQVQSCLHGLRAAAEHVCR